MVGSQGQLLQPTEGSLNLIDFEQANDPFEMATLKALNDRAELESIWTRENSTGSQLPPPSNTNISGSQTPPLGNTTAPSVSNQTLTTPTISSHTSTTPPVPKPRRFVPKPTVSDGGVSSNLGTQSTPAASHSPTPGSSQPQTPSPVTPAAVTTVVGTHAWFSFSVVVHSTSLVAPEAATKSYDSGGSQSTGTKWRSTFPIPSDYSAHQFSVSTSLLPWYTCPTQSTPKQTSALLCRDRE